MEFFLFHLIEVTERIWRTMFEVSPVRSKDSWALPDFDLAGYVDVHGAWQGRIVVQSSRDFGVWVAQQMFALGDETPLDDQIIDCMKELANMIGGNFKSELPHPTEMSVPVALFTSEELAPPSSSDNICRLAFSVKEYSFLIKVYSAVK